jgi:ADP-ribosylglycohydrolase
MISERVVAQEPWRWTDDTAMAVCLYQVLLERGQVDQDELAQRFAAAAYAARTRTATTARVCTRC